MKNFRPQKAPSESIKLEDIRYPMLGSFKLDGIRCTIIEGECRSTSNKQLPSAFAAHHFGQEQFEGIDGELIAYNPTPGLVYNESVSAVMTHQSQARLIFNVFDIANDGWPYANRLAMACEICKGNSDIKILEQVVLRYEDELLAYEELALSLGHEGLMLRTHGGIYKFGRCTAKEYNIFKFVRHLTSEAEVIGFYEQMENQNEKVISPTGLSARSTHQANKRGKGTLGGFNCRDLKTGVKFDIGTGRGLDAALRQEIWNNQAEYLKRICRYIHKPYGAKDKPRQPIWAGWRAKIDMEPDDEHEAF